MTAGDGFISRGFELYPDAALAMLAFHSHLFKQLHDALDAPRDWGSFEPTRRLEASGGDPGSGWRVWVIENGVVPGGRKVAAEIGYWWNPPTEDRAPLLYASAWGVPAFAGEGLGSGATVFSWAGRAMVGCAMPRDLKASPELARGLEIVIKALNGEVQAER